MQDKKNVLIVILASALVWLGMEVFLKPQQSAQTSVVQNIPSGSINQPASRVDSLARNLPSLTLEGPSIPFQNSKIQGSLDIKGGVIRQCSLKDYLETTDPNSKPVSILSKDSIAPSENSKMYAAYFGWVGSAESADYFPNPQTIWTCNKSELTPEQPITLSWENSKGIQFFLDFAMDQEYLISVTQRVENKGEDSIQCTPTSTLIRQGPVITSGYMMLHEGPIGMANGKLQELSYKDVVKLGQSPWMDLSKSASKCGWLGMTDKYWLAALIPAQGAKGRFIAEGGEFYLSQTQGHENLLKRSETQISTSHVFFGPKKLSLLEDYEKKMSIDHFDMAVDFGWFYFITKPMFNLLTWLQESVGNFGLAILIMTIAIKILFFPLSSKSFRAMSRMRLLQPQIQGLKSRFKDDKLRLNQEMMNLYKREKINPASGCLPMLVQIPIFFSLYKVLFISIEMRHAPFWGWIQDLSAPDPTSVFSGFGLFPWTLPIWLHIGIWPILMGITMVGQQLMNASNITDSQQKIMLTYVVPIMFTFMLAQFPAGLVIYWTWSNFLTIAQQWVMMRYHQSV
jgi:YidC/Oxa1 family membrane protein insertase